MGPNAYDCAEVGQCRHKGKKAVCKRHEHGQETDKT